MTRRTLLIAAVIAAEAVMIWTHQEEGWAVARWTYVTLWNLAPKPAGMEHEPPPDRFLGR